MEEGSFCLIGAAYQAPMDKSRIYEFLYPLLFKDKCSRDKLFCPG